MSNAILREHMREYHNFRFRDEINSNSTYTNFHDTAIQNPPQQQRKQIVGKNVKRKIKKERKKIVMYQKQLVKNVRHNVNVLARLSIQTQNNAPEWQQRLEIIKNSVHSLGK